MNTEMTIVEAVQMLYPGEFERGNVSFAQHSPSEPILIEHWAVPDQEKPDELDLVAQIPQLIKDFEIKQAEQKARQEFQQKNQDLLATLDKIDKQSIRAIREGNQERIDELEAEAVAIRAQFK